MEAPTALLPGFVGVQHRDLRRRLGPTAVALLVELAGEAEVDSIGRWVVSASARTLSGNLGIDKDTAAAALHRLAAAGLILRLPQHRRAGGRFEAGIYQLCLDAGVNRADRPDTSLPVRSGAHGAQLSLLDDTDPTAGPS